MTTVTASLQTWIVKQTELLKLECSSEKSDLEEQISSLTSSECEKQGLSLLNLEIVSSHTTLFSRFALSLKRHGDNPLQSSFKVGDEVTLICSLATGLTSEFEAIISNISTSKVEIILDNDDDFEENNWSRYRLNRRASQVTYSKLCNGLKAMCKSDHPLANLLFNEQEFHNRQDSIRMREQVNTNLNSSQVNAIQNSLKNSHVSIIHGPPGTGKTSTLAEFVLQAVNNGQRVLVCAPSNVAVDNILERVLSFQCKAARCVRIGHPARVNPSILSCCLDSLVANEEGTAIVKDIHKEIQELRNSNNRPRKVPASEYAVDRRAARQELKLLRSEARDREKRVVAELLKACNVVCCTCVGASSKIIAGLDLFDYVVIDEAAQALEAACWLPILRGRRLVLGGDHCQLPATVKCRAAEQGGLAVSLFERLALRSNGRFDSIKYLLDTQYRMHADICSWASKHVYDSLLRSHDSVAAHTVQELLPTAVAAPADNSACYPALTLIDTAGCDMDEVSCEGGSQSNVFEAEIVKRQVLLLLSAGLLPHQIGVITPYNGQVDLIKQLLRTDEDSECAGVVIRSTVLSAVEVRTVDGFQGGEKECIVMSLVRSNKSRTVGFLGDRRRINVGVTRARRNLSVVCNSETCGSDPFIATLLQHMSALGDHRTALEYMDDSVWQSLSLSIPVAATHESGADLPSSSCSILTSQLSSNSGKLKAKHAKRLVQQVQAPSVHTPASEPVPHHIKQPYGPVKRSAVEPYVLQDNKFQSDLSSALQRFSEIHSHATDITRILIGKHKATVVPATTRHGEEVTEHIWLRFPASLTSFERMMVHSMCESSGLFHRSIGQSKLRHIEISCREFPLADICNTTIELLPTASEEQTKCSDESAITATLPQLIINPIQQVLSSAKKAAIEADKKTQQQAPKSNKTKPAKPKPLPDGDDAALEQAFQEAQAHARYNQYRLSSTSMPNPEKERCKEKLQSIIQESRTQRQAHPVDSEDAKSTGGGGGVRKKVEKKPIPNFGGGKIGSS